jgi:CubicO group peptidase (beta-lactamase class C family)
LNIITNKFIKKNIALKKYFLFLPKIKVCLLTRQTKILLILLLLSMVSINPGAMENNVVLVDKLIPNNVRITNNTPGTQDFPEADNLVNSFLHNWSIAGASIAVAKDGKLIYAKGFGYADTVQKIQTEPFNKFRIASISKLVTAVALMKLHEEGKLSLDAKVFGPGGILDDPYFADPKDKRVYDITVEQLLSHEAGWTQRYGDQMFMPTLVAEKMNLKPPVDTKAIIRFALDKRLHYTPGMGRAYSNLGYSVLGLVIEKITGMPYEKYCKQAILEPIGIYDMTIAGNLQSEKAPYEVTYYEPTNDVLKPSIYGTGEMVTPRYGGNDIRSLGSAGAWLATAPDLMRLLLSVDGFQTRPDILTNQSIQFMTDNSNGFAPVGWKTTVMDGNWYRTGSFPGTAGMLKRQPDGIAWVVLLNSSAWCGPEIYSYIGKMMNRFITRIDPMPDYDLFNNSLPVPLNPVFAESSYK